jgi:NADH-quinone oxidoreductase subunit L
MGGLKDKMPFTFWTFLIGGFALSGFPLITAGFWSKDEILAGSFGSGQILVFATLALSALLTAFYTMRQITLTFLGQPRTKAAEHAQENKPVMTIPLVVLSVFAVTAGWVGIPASFPLLGGLIPNWFDEFVGSMLHSEVELAHTSYIPLITSLVVALGGLLAGWLVYRNTAAGAKDPLEKLGFVYKIFKYKYGIDELYRDVFIRPSVWISEVFAYKIVDKMILDGIVEGIGKLALGLGSGLRKYFDVPVINQALTDGSSTAVRKSGEAMRPVQSGKIQDYMLVAVALVVITGLVGYYFFGRGGM